MKTNYEDKGITNPDVYQHNVLNKNLQNILLKEAILSLESQQIPFGYVQVNLQKSLNAQQTDYCQKISSLDLSKETPS
jgi:hypothetical protein